MTEKTHSTKEPINHVAPHVIHPLSRRRQSKSPIVIRLVILALVVSLVYLLFFKKDISTGSFMDRVKTNQFQSVSLANGQIYFGKIIHSDTETVTFTDVYYLKAQPQETESTPVENQSFSLTKLGSEVFGPEDTLFIERKQMLFWENLKNDSDVVKAIADDKK